MQQVNRIAGIGALAFMLGCGGVESVPPLDTVWLADAFPNPTVATAFDKPGGDRVGLYPLNRIAEGTDYFALCWGVHRSAFNSKKRSFLREHCAGYVPTGKKERTDGQLWREFKRYDGADSAKRIEDWIYGS